MDRQTFIRRARQRLAEALDTARRYDMPEADELAARLAGCERELRAGTVRDFGWRPVGGTVDRNDQKKINAAGDGAALRAIVDALEEERDRLNELSGRHTRRQRERLADIEEALQLADERADQVGRDERDRLLDALRGGHTVRGDSWDGAPDHGGRPDRPAVGTGTGRTSEAARLLARSKHLGDELPERLARAVEDDEAHPQADEYVQAAASVDYARAFGKIVRDPLNGHRSFNTAELSAWQRAERFTRSLDTGVPGGGVMIPTHLDPSILLSSDGVTDPLREISRVIPLLVGHTWHGVSSDGVGAESLPEGQEAADDQEPVLDAPEVETHKQSSWVEITYEALQDMLNVEGELRKLFADKKIEHEAPLFTKGTGVNEPEGLVTGLGASQTENTAGAGAVVAADIYTLQNALPPRFQPAARWTANLETINLLDQEETGNGAKKFPRVGDENPVLLRKRLHELSELDAPDTTGNFPIVYGNYRHFGIVDRSPAVIEFVPHVFGANRRPLGVRGFHFWWRVGSGVLVPNAFRRLEVA